MEPIKENCRFRHRFVSILVSLVLFATTGTLLINGCGKQEKPTYLSAKQFVDKYYSHEKLIGSHRTLKWSFRSVIGVKGPYILGNSLPIQSNPGQTITFTVRDGPGSASVEYTPETEDLFFIGIPVVNAEWHNAMIICKSVPETADNEPK